ncbi:MAG: ATP-binding protein [Ktedonobacterales bacterium]
MNALSPRATRSPRPHVRAFSRREVNALWSRWLQSLRQFTTFEKVIVANSVIIVLDTAAGWWITQHNPETYHYLIDTGFIALATLLSLAVNFAVLKAAFAPLHTVMGTIQAVEQGNLEARVEARASDADVVALARAFNGMLDRLQEMRDDVAARVLRAQEDERRRLALELHDQTGQSLTALTLHAQAIAQRLAAEQIPAAVQARAQAERLRALAERTLVEVQALARQLRPALLDDLGLVAAVRWLAEDARDRLHVEAVVRVRHAAADDGACLASEVETALFRIAQESLTNAVRHGHARHVNLVLHCTSTHLRMMVTDDGAGFEAAQHGVRASVAGQGLDGMRERARLAGGSLRVRSHSGRGCVVCVVIPLAAGRLAVSQPTPADSGGLIAGVS